VKDEQRQDLVKTSIRKSEGASVAYLENNSLIAIVMPRVFDVRGSKIYRSNLRHVARSGQRESEGAGPASDIEDAPAGLIVDEFQKRNGQARAPAAHKQFVTVPIGCCERGCVHWLSPTQFRGGN